MIYTPPPLFDTFSIKSVLIQATKRLSSISDSASLDAELLLAHCLDKNRTYLHTWPEKCLDKKQFSGYQSLIEKRATDYPVAYLLGAQSFWTLDLLVTPDVLIPRPETELLVETALEKIELIKNPKVLDLGTGSGAIALAIASERPDAKLVACDISSSALKVARVNAKNNGLEAQITFVQSSWFSNIEDNNFDLIVSNPPYIDPDDLHLQQTIRYEPRGALVADNSGMKDIETIIYNSTSKLAKNGWLIIEHGYDQGLKTQECFSEYDYSEIRTFNDLSNQDRVTTGLQKH